MYRKYLATFRAFLNHNFLIETTTPSWQTLLCLALKIEAMCMEQLLPFATIARLNGYNVYTRAKWQKATENNGDRVVVTSSDNWLLRRQKRKSINTCFDFVSKRSLRYYFLSFFLFKIFPELQVTLDNKRNVGNSKVLPLVNKRNSKMNRNKKWNWIELTPLDSSKCT